MKIPVELCYLVLGLEEDNNSTNILEHSILMVYRDLKIEYIEFEI